MSELPKTLKVDKKVTTQAAKRDMISNEGFFCFAVTKGTNREGNNKDLEGNEKVSRLQIVLTLAPLKNEKDPKSAVHDLAVQKYLILPDRGPNSPEPEDADAELAEQGKKAKQLSKDLRAILGPDTVPYAPRKNESGRYEYNGEEIDKDEYEGAVADLTEKALEVAYRMWADESRWITPKKFVYAKVKQDVQRDGSLRPNIAFLAEKLPHDAVLLPYNEWFKAPTK